MSYKVKSVYANSLNVYEALGSTFVQLYEQIISDFVSRGLISSTPVIHIDPEIKQYVVTRDVASEEAANQYLDALQSFFSEHTEVSSYMGSEIISE